MWMICTVDAVKNREPVIKDNFVSLVLRGLKHGLTVLSNDQASIQNIEKELSFLDPVVFPDNIYAQS